MTIELNAGGRVDEPMPWLDPRRYWGGIARAVVDIDSPVAVLHLGALRHNTHDMLRRAGGKPIRVASKSIRVRSVIDALLRQPGYAGVLAYTLGEALWLAETIDDIVVGYPTAERGAIATLAGDDRAAARITLMIDSLEHLDLIDAVALPGARAEVRVCIELDASFRAPGLGHVGVRRSPLRTPDEVRALAEAVVARPGFRLVGIMAYEAQIAGQGDDLDGRPAWSATLRAIQRRSWAELRERRAAVVAEVRAVAELEFVNGGGTGSLELTASDDSVTEIAAGSGVFGGHLFDHYRAFTPAPAAAFGLSVVRKPAPELATILGGGWVASGPPGADRLPLIVWPEGLEMLPREMAGEVQTPVSGDEAAALRLGDRVWLRHTKSGELSERVAAFQVVDGDRIVDELQTYRGEGRGFV
ncbi:MAG TPA: alanine racemase [Plantibacter sp.]|uniref:alanine racemase n=1 Tax=unclassified Plantibacter TaxID=2624265 RepID=UPI002D14FD3C|nr:alanine racemase [Plantibacter sp.]